MNHNKRWLRRHSTEGGMMYNLITNLYDFPPRDKSSHSMDAPKGMMLARLSSRNLVNSYK